MATEIVMPRLSDSMEEGTILKWLASKGDEINRGDALVEIETDKANMTYESDSAGTLIEIVAPEGATLPIGEVIARLGKADEVAEGTQEKRARATDAESESKDSPEDESASQAAPSRADGAGERVKASPVARRIARDAGVDLGSLQGSGPGGRIVRADVEAASRPAGDDGGSPEAAETPATTPARAAAPEPADRTTAKGEVSVQEPTRIQRTVSRRMAESKATAPDYSMHVEIDMSACVKLRERLSQLTHEPELARDENGATPSLNDMIVKASANALRERPRMNGAYRDGRFESYSRVNIGIAVAAQDALVVPTLFDADQRSLGEIARRSRELIARVRDGSITPPELSGGTFTVSNLGMYGIESFTGVINPPQAALLTVGAVKRKPVVDEHGRIVVREMMAATLTCDHRILYGADGAQFLARVRELLEDALALAL